jgi:hypothetical protein
MFLENELDFVTADLYTTRFLGKLETAIPFLALMRRYGGVFAPERWDTKENTRRPFAFESLSALIEEWTTTKNTHYLFFTRTHPVEIQIALSINRFARAKFNTCRVYIRDEYLRSTDNLQEFLDFVLDLSCLFQVDYGYVGHERQVKLQSPPWTPAERLPGIFWANLFGRPYIDFFGRDKLLSSPSYKAVQHKQDLIMLLSAPSPLADEMLTISDEVRHLKNYLNNNAFAGPRFPAEPCFVPQFDFGDVRNVNESQAQATSVGHNIWDTLEASGYKLISESGKQLTFRGTDNSVVIVDLKKKDLSLHLPLEANDTLDNLQ